jgi:hypothetical protein
MEREMWRVTFYHDGEGAEKGNSGQQVAQGQPCAWVGTGPRTLGSKEAMSSLLG